jgi:hypothetical protein
MSGDCAQINRDNAFQIPAQVSPLSPTFGPRRGVVPTGTVERRRPSLPLVHIPSSRILHDTESVSGSSDAFGGAGHSEPPPGAVNRSGGMAKTVSWEAAPVNVHDLKNRVYESTGVLDQRKNKEIWKELIDLNNRKRQLQKQLGCIPKDKGPPLHHNSMLYN